MDKGRIEQIGTPGEVYDNPATAFVHGFIGKSIVLPVDVSGGSVRLGGQAAQYRRQWRGVRRRRNCSSGAMTCRSGRPAAASLEGAVRHVRSFGPIQRAEVALSGGEGKTVIEIDAPRDRELQAGEIVGLQPRRYRIFAAQD